MTGGLLALKWNNHRSTFTQVLSTIRAKETYSDATIACDGKFYPVHKLVLSTCSEYFEQIFYHTQCKHPVVVLKDIKSSDFDALLNYMYLGEVNVLQEDLSSLIKSAECLKIRGLAVPDEEVNKVEKATKHTNLLRLNEYFGTGSRSLSPKFNAAKSFSSRSQSPKLNPVKILPKLPQNKIAVLKTELGAKIWPEKEILKTERGETDSFVHNGQVKRMKGEPMGIKIEGYSSINNYHESFQANVPDENAISEPSTSDSTMNQFILWDPTTDADGENQEPDDNTSALKTEKFVQTEVPSGAEATKEAPKRKRCFMCDRTKDRKTKWTCIVCKSAVCAEHSSAICKTCGIDAQRIEN